MTTTSQTIAAQPVAIHPVRPRGGTALVASAIATIAPFGLSLLVGLAFAGRVYSSPFSADGTLHDYFAGHQAMVQTIAFLQFGSAVGLAVFTCVLWSRLRQLASAGSAASYVAAAGGLVAAAFLALNALVQWVLTRGEVVAQPALVKALNYFFWILGGPAHTAWLGLLLGGVSLIALRRRLLPRWFSLAGLVVTGLAELSLLAILTKQVVAFIPLGRFPALVWLVAASFLLPAGRAAERG